MLALSDQGRKLQSPRLIVAKFLLKDPKYLDLSARESHLSTAVGLPGKGEVHSMLTLLMSNRRVCLCLGETRPAWTPLPFGTWACGMQHGFGLWQGEGPGRQGR